MAKTTIHNSRLTVTINGTTIFAYDVGDMTTDEYVALLDALQEVLDKYTQGSNTALAKSVWTTTR